MNQIHIIHPLIWIMLLTHHQNYHSNQDHVFQCHVLAMIRYFFSHTARWWKSEPEYKIITILG